MLGYGYLRMVAPRAGLTTDDDIAYKANPFRREFRNGLHTYGGMESPHRWQGYRMIIAAETKSWPRS